MFLLLFLYCGKAKVLACVHWIWISWFSEIRRLNTGVFLFYFPSNDSLWLNCILKIQGDAFHIKYLFNLPILKKKHLLMDGSTTKLLTIQNQGQAEWQTSFYTNIFVLYTMHFIYKRIKYQYKINTHVLLRWNVFCYKQLSFIYLIIIFNILNHQLKIAHKMLVLFFSCKQTLN